METLSRKEIEHLKKLELLRKILQLIFFKHIKLLTGLFVALLLLIFAFIYFFVTFSPTRYIARISLYYHPKQTKNINPYEAKYVLQMLNRETIRIRFYKETAENGKKVPCVISVSSEKKDKSHYHISVSSGSAQQAVDAVNAFAKLCVSAYIEERSASLLNWKNVLQQKKQEVFRDIQKVNLEKNRIGAPLHAPLPEHSHGRSPV